MFHGDADLYIKKHMFGGKALKKKNITLLIIICAAVGLLMATVVLFILSSEPRVNLSSRIIDSIESIMADWEELEQETSKITVTPDMLALYSPESLKKLCRLLGGDDDLQISIYYTNHFNSFNRHGKVIVTNDYVGIPFIDNEGFNIYYYFMVTSNGKVYDIITGPWK
jgi:hypothetical protein